MPPVLDSNLGVAIFAKAPIEGFAKSRLIPRLGPKGAAALQAQFIRRTVQTAVASKLGPISIWCAPDSAHEIFASLETSYGLSLQSQSMADLGTRMLAAFEATTPGRPLLVIGTDCPALLPVHLVKCAECLCNGADAVFIPTEDGGYALVGLREPEPSLFEGIPWSTNTVMIETRLRAKQAGLVVSETDVLWDVDTPEDYDRAVSAGFVSLA